jgi:hypothetical protein
MDVTPPETSAVAPGSGDGLKTQSLVKIVLRWSGLRENPIPSRSQAPALSMSHIFLPATVGIG